MSLARGRLRTENAVPPTRQQAQSSPLEWWNLGRGTGGSSSGSEPGGKGVGEELLAVASELSQGGLGEVALAILPLVVLLLENRGGQAEQGGGVGGRPPPPWSGGPRWH